MWIHRLFRGPGEDLKRRSALADAYYFSREHGEWKALTEEGERKMARKTKRALVAGDSVAHKDGTVGVVIAVCDWIDGSRRVGIVSGPSAEQLAAYYAAIEGVGDGHENPLRPFKIRWDRVESFVVRP